GSLAASADENTVRLWNVTNGQEIRQLPLPLAQSVQCLAFSGNASCLLAGKVDGKVCLWDVETGALKHEWNGHTAAVLAVAFAAEGDAVFSAAKDNTIRRWELHPTAGAFRAGIIALGSQARPAAVKD